MRSSLWPGTLISGLAHDDARVDGEGAVGVGEHGVEVELADLGVLLHELGHLHDGLAERCYIGGRLAAHPIEDRLALDLADHLRGVLLRERDDAEGYVL